MNAFSSHLPPPKGEVHGAECKGSTNARDGSFGSKAVVNAHPDLRLLLAKTRRGNGPTIKDVFPEMPALILVLLVSLQGRKASDFGAAQGTAS
jgi:hypothetical protein